MVDIKHKEFMSGHTLLTMGAMILLSLITLRVNKNIVTSGVSLDEAKFSVLAISLASSMIEEANSKAFDANTVEDAVNGTDLLSTVLGPELNEKYADFDDCDDYNGYQKTVTNIPSANFKIACSVFYINSASPNTNAGTRTWNKKINVSVTSPSMKDTVKMSSVISYWYFR